MAKKKRETFLEALGNTITDMAEAASVAATGSTIEVLERASEDEIKARPVKRKAKTARKKKVVAKKRSKPVKKKRTSKARKKR